jgi:hypothetical protein
MLGTSSRLHSSVTIIRTSHQELELRDLIGEFHNLLVVSVLVRVVLTGPSIEGQHTSKHTVAVHVIVPIVKVLDDLKKVLTREKW